MSKSVYVVIRLELNTDASTEEAIDTLAQEVTSSMEYECGHDVIIDTEVVGTYTREPKAD